ncbi:MAG: SsrA-binding protein SmpB [Bacteroidetes bacterium]|jgi:SsrA-binding protein|nr:SsrA-binding protein SmpB [Bacteroidota bacterium]
MSDSGINIKNKRASFDYEWIEKYEAGIKLYGTEIKSIRGGKASLVDTFCRFHDHELYVENMHISEYEFGTYLNHEPKRSRKLLLKKQELKKLEKKVREKGHTIIATRLYINARNLAKVQIALARGKKEYDKREDIKKKDLKREHDRLRKI